jgi:hypothetical protein
MEVYTHHGSNHPPPMAPEAAKMPPRYQVGRWRYNTRVALAIVPSILMLAGAGGGTLLGTLLVGAMISYILDVLKMAEVRSTSISSSSAYFPLRLQPSGCPAALVLAPNPL